MFIVEIVGYWNVLAVPVVPPTGLVASDPRVGPTCSSSSMAGTICLRPVTSSSFSSHLSTCSVNSISHATSGL
jgi:hypothetical protein